MKEQKEELGIYLKATCCMDCEWYEKPSNLYPHIVCPACGGHVQSFTGQYRVIKTPRFFGGRSIRVVGFKKK